MDKRWHWTRLKGWIEISNWRDTVGHGGTPPPAGSLLLANPGASAFLAVAPLPWITGLEPRQLSEKTAADMKSMSKGVLIGLAEEADDGSCGFVWTSADGLSSGKMLARLAPEDPPVILVITAIWPSDRDDLNEEFDIIAASLRRHE